LNFDDIVIDPEKYLVFNNEKEITFPKKEIETLKELEAYHREFIGNLSHELKTPIFNIQGYILTLLDGGLEDKNINREYLLRTEKSINRMIDIVKDLDTISQLESGINPPNHKQFAMTKCSKT